LERKQRLRDVLPNQSSTVRYVDHVGARGAELYDAVSLADAEGVVGKWISGSYHTDVVTTNWVEVKNLGYSQIVGRHELFADRKVIPKASAAYPSAGPSRNRGLVGHPADRHPVRSAWTYTTQFGVWPDARS
jgi:hypothetical protein